MTKLMNAQRLALERMADDSHGVGGSDWYPSEQFGSTGHLYRITDAGRALLQETEHDD